MNPLSLRAYLARDRSFPLGRPVPEGDVDEKRATIERSLAVELDETIPFGDIVRMGYWQTHHGRKARPWRELGDQHYDESLEAFKRAKGAGTEIAVFRSSGLGVYITEDDLRYLILLEALRFDWSEAHRLVNRIDGIAERAKEWWGPAADGGDGRWRMKRRRTAEAERRRFLDRAKGLMTMVFGAIEGENPRDGQIPSRARSDNYRAKLNLLSGLIDQQEKELEDALQRSAQTCYGRGMFYGAALIALLCGILGGLFLLEEVPAVYGIAFPACGACQVV